MSTNTGNSLQVFLKRTSKKITFVRHFLLNIRGLHFLVVGAAGAFIDNAALAFLVEAGSVPIQFAALGSKEASIIFMFLLNECWTFSDIVDSHFKACLWRFLKSNVVRLVGVGVGISVLVSLNQWFGVWYLLANIVGIGCGFMFNYVLESYATWEVHTQQ